MCVPLCSLCVCIWAFVYNACAYVFYTVLVCVLVCGGLCIVCVEGCVLYVWRAVSVKTTRNHAVCGNSETFKEALVSQILLRSEGTCHKKICLQILSSDLRIGRPADTYLC